MDSNSNILTFGAEEEFMVLGPNDLPLKFDLSHFQNGATGIFSVSQEVHHGSLEVSTPISKNLYELSCSISHQRQFISQKASELGGWVCGRSTVPWLRIDSCELLPKAEHIVSKYKESVYGLLTFGMHVHIGNIEKGKLIDIYNAWRYYASFIIALSANSVGWEGRDSGTVSVRTLKLGSLPRSGLPRMCQNIRDIDEIQSHMNYLEENDFAQSYQIWEDFRVHVDYGTLEIRVADISRRSDDAAAIACFVGAITEFLHNKEDLHEHAILLNKIPTRFLEENRWQAHRYGYASARFISPSGIRTASELLRELNDSLQEVYHAHNVAWVHSHIHSLLNRSLDSFYYEMNDPKKHYNEIINV